MARRVIGQLRTWPRGWRGLLSLFIAAGVGVVLIRNVQAVHDLAFELDGNIINDGFVPNGTFDWENFFDANGNSVPVLPDPSRPGFVASRFVKDFNQNANGSFNAGDDTTFATGSKDTLPISGWQCNHDNNVNSKIDIANAYALAYKAPNGDEVVYFGLERNANTGDANVAFWFLQDDVGCSSTLGTQTFAGAHRDGDLLVVSAFTNGGDVSTVNVYRWTIDAAHPDPGFLDPTPVASGGDCRGTATQPPPGPGDISCAAANRTEIAATPWVTASKTTGIGQSVPTAQFFEGGLNLTKSGLSGHCFNVFIGDTRSSQSLTATLFDFARGRLGECTSSTVTTPSITSPTSIGATASLL